MSEIKLKRAYDPADGGDGFRVYVDRLWPQGLSHETFHYDLWDKEIAPTTDLRHWFHEDPAGRWPEFASKYMQQLQDSQAATELRKILAPHAVVTLLYSSRDESHNNAVVLRDYLTRSSDVEQAGGRNN